MGMTKEEALKILKYRSGWNLNIRDVTALNMAIEALKQQDRIIQILDDCDLEAWEILEKIKEAVRV
jgi:hypothetical protein